MTCKVPSFEISFFFAVFASSTAFLGDVRLDGAEGADVLRGSVGNDTLIGGTETDTCNGGAGTDTASGCETISYIP